MSPASGRRASKEPSAGSSPAAGGGAAKGTSGAAATFTPTIRVAALAGEPDSARAEALVAYAFEGGKGVEGLGDGRLVRGLGRLVVSEGFRAKRGETLLWHPPGRRPAARVIVAGLGRRDEYDADAVRTAAAAAARRAASSNARAITYSAPPSPRGEAWSIQRRSSLVAEGVMLGTYRMRKYLTGEERREGDALRSASILTSRKDLPEARAAVRRTAMVCAAVNLARDLVNEPAMAMTPVRTAEIAEQLAARAGLECRVHDENGIAALGMGAFLGVAQGSHQPPRLIHLTYRPGRPASRKIALVGKGLTFDSGGLSLKTASGMETMKLDKAGAAAVLATLVTLRDLEAPVEVHGLMGMTENMPGGSALKPGDIVRTACGKTVEVLNTDAEGRLVLADLLSYTRTLGVDEVIDVATLTGACMVALGPYAGGLFSNDGALSGRLLAAAAEAGERLWPLPLYDEYRHQIRSEFADIKNTADRYGGAITAALFLREFLGRKTPWAHLDVAGPAYLESNGHPYMRRGATGMGVRTLLAYLSSFDPSS